MRLKPRNRDEIFGKNIQIELGRAFRTFSLLQTPYYFLPGLTFSLKVLEAVKEGEFDAFISSGSPVCGLRPFLAAR